MLWGAICGLLPDLDLLVPLGDVVKEFTYHRGPSHSLFVLAALTPPFVWLILKLHRHMVQYRLRWYSLVFLAFATHVLLDCFTVYGTQIFWPLTTPPVMWSTIFIIDPTYSIPLFVGVLAALILGRRSSWGHALNTACLILSTAYILWSVGAKLYIEDVAQKSLQRQNITYRKVLTVPSPFNTVLWRILVMDDEKYYEGFYSLFDPTRNIKFTQHPSDPQLLKGIEKHWPVRRLQWFTHGFYSVQRLLDDIVITDLRMGMEPSYVFRFKIGKLGNPHAIPTDSQRVYSERQWGQLHWVWQRIWTPEPAMSHLQNARNYIHPNYSW